MTGRVYLYHLPTLLGYSSLSVTLKKQFLPKISFETKFLDKLSYYKLCYKELLLLRNIFTLLVTLEDIWLLQTKFRL